MKMSTARDIVVLIMSDRLFLNCFLVTGSSQSTVSSYTSESDIEDQKGK